MAKPMGEPTSFRGQIYVPGKKKFKLQRQLTFEIISGWIRLQGFDDYTTNGLIELASKYPTQALPSFRRNFNLMIERVRAKRRAELQGQNIQEVPEETNANQSCVEEECKAEDQVQGIETGGELVEGESVERDNGAEDRAPASTPRPHRKRR